MCRIKASTSSDAIDQELACISAYRAAVQDGFQEERFILILIGYKFYV
jgi:hypothetical protein